MSFYDTFKDPEGLIGRISLVTMNRGHAAISEWGMGFYTFGGDETMLDVGCGGGMQLRRLLSKAPKGRAYGIDISEEACRKSRRINREALGDRCFVENATAEDLPFDDSMFDLVTTVESAYFWPHLEKGLSEIRRVMKEDATLILILESHDKGSKWQDRIEGMTVYSDDEMVKYFDEAGFNDIRCELKGDWMCVLGKK